MFEEGPGLAEGDGSDLEELKDYVMAELLWDPSLDPDQVIGIHHLELAGISLCKDCPVRSTLKS